ncbi:class I SAM-dependent methyltransferase, partial [bacterium]|nr:class I SAM-dependent methyltransferase [Candidatus Elulimicrobium humile]
MDVNQQDACHFCTSVVTFDLYLGQRPIVNNLAEDSGERDMFDLYMGQCRNCALVNVYHNLDPNIFYSDYSTPSHWKFEPHLENLVARITKNYSMESRILDIGCNDGRFLKYLANNGFQNLIGVEPGKNVANLAQKHNFVIYNNYFDSVFVQQLNKWEKKFDIVVSRQVLEHIKNIKEFLLNISLVIKPGGVLILEVPDSDLNWEHLDYGIWEEHFNYFNRQSL